MIPRAHIILLAAIVVALVVSHYSDSIDPYYLDVLTSIGINIILASSLNLVNGHTGQFSLGHAGFMSIGAYLSGCVTVFLGPKLFGDSDGTPLEQNALFFAALLAGGLSAALAGLLIGAPSLRLKGDYLALVTLGFGEIIRVIFQNIDAVGGALGFIGLPPYTNFAWTYGWAALTVFVVVCLVNSTYGRGFLAIHDDEIASESIGLSPTRYKITAFIIGAFFAGVAGGLYGHYKLSIDPRGFDFTSSIEIVIMVILGGMGNTTGVILAAIFLTVLPEGLRTIFPEMLRAVLPGGGGPALLKVFQLVAKYRMVIYSLLLIVLMLVRPQGLFNFRLRERTTRR